MVHGADTSQRARMERREALRTLREIYDQRHQYEPSAQELLMNEIREHEIMTTKQIQNWLAINATVLQSNNKRAKKLAI